MIRQIQNRTVQTLALAALLIGANGCMNESVSPTPSPEDAPALPNPERLSFDFDFFQEPSSLDRAPRANFANAYIRAAVAGAITHLVLVPPVTAFSLALHTVPSPQDDGSYLWIYTWVDGDGGEEAQMRLRGTPLGGHHVAWEMRISSTLDGFVDERWFEGETWDEGDKGVWRFHDPDRDGNPHVARLEWGADDLGNYLRFVDAIDNVDDSIEFRETGTVKSFTFTDFDAPNESWYVKWDESDGSGSLRAPDYNDGEPACWDEHQIDTECGVS